MGDHPAPQAARPAAVDDVLACRRACKPCARRSDSTAVVPSTKSMYMYLGPKTVHAGPGGTQDGVGPESGIMAGLDAETYVALICELYKNQDGFVFSQDPNFQTSTYSNVINPMARAEAGGIVRAPNYRKLSMNEYVAVVCHWLHRYYSLRTDLKSPDEKKIHQKKWTLRMYRTEMETASDENPDCMLRDEARGPVFVTESGEIGDYGELYVDETTGYKVNDVTFHALLQVNRKNFWEYCAECRPELLSYRVKRLPLLFECFLLWIDESKLNKRWGLKISETMSTINGKFRKEWLRVVQGAEETGAGVNVFEFGKHKLGKVEAEKLLGHMYTVKIPFTKNIDAFPLSEFSPRDLVLTVKRMRVTPDEDLSFFPPPLSETARKHVIANNVTADNYDDHSLSDWSPSDLVLTLYSNTNKVTTEEYYIFYNMLRDIDTDLLLQGIKKTLDRIEEHDKKDPFVKDDSRDHAGVLEKHFWGLHHPRGQRELYKFLGVDQYASLSEITKMYHKKSRQMHPDKAQQRGENTEQVENDFKHLNRAYEILRTEDTRKIYDERGDETLDDENLKDRYPQFKVV